MRKKFIAALLIMMMLGTLLTACTTGTGSENTTGTTGNTGTDSGETVVDTTNSGGKARVYYLNPDYDLDDEWQELAELYTKETGTDVTVKSVEAGEYETTLIEAMTGSGAPTLFKISGATGFENWKDYCYDLIDTDIFKNLTSEEYSLKYGDKIAAVSYSIETYGIIVNKTLLTQAGYSVDDIKSFDDLKSVAEDITARYEEDELEFAAFTSNGLDSTSGSRFSTYLANVPIHFEYEDRGIITTSAIKGTYISNLRDIWDLFINNSTCEASVLANKSILDAREEFMNDEAVFYFNSADEYNTLTGKVEEEDEDEDTDSDDSEDAADDEDSSTSSDSTDDETTDEDVFTDDELAMIPVYIGLDGEETQGLCTGSENYWCVNNKAAEKNIEATLDFINWCTTNEEATRIMSEEMKLTIPYTTAAESENVFVKQDAENTAAGLMPVLWHINTIPSEDWKTNLCDALAEYSANPDSETWGEVKSAFIDGWADAYEEAH